MMLSPSKLFNGFIRRANDLAIRGVPKTIFQIEWAGLGLSLLLAGMQAVFSVLLFPVNKLPLLQPILAADHAMHFYHVQRVIEFLKLTGRVWGYNPFLLAGYPTVNFGNVDYVGLSLLSLAFQQFFPAAVAYKMTFLLLLILIPVMIFWACRNLRLGLEQSFLTSLSLIIALNSFWLYKLFISWGPFCFVSSFALAVWVFSEAYVYSRNGSKQRWCLYVFLGFWGLSLHAYFFLFLLSALSFYILIKHRDIQRERLRALIWGLCIMVIANLYYIIPTLQSLKYYYGFDQVSCYPPGLAAFWTEIKDNGNPVFLFMLATAFLSLPVLLQQRARRFFFLSTYLAFVFLIFFSYCTWPWFYPWAVKLETYRLQIPGMMLAPLLFVLVLSRFFARRKWIIYLFLSILLVYQFLDIKNLRNKCAGISSDIMHWVGDALLDRVGRYTDRSGRILIEDFPHQAYAWSFFMGPLQYFSQREYLAQIIYGHETAHVFSTLSGGRIFRRAIDDVPINEMNDYLDLYNVRWIIAQTPASKAYFHRFPRFFYFKETFSSFDFFEVNRSPSYFIRGNGKIDVTLDRIRISQATPGEIILKYHYHDILKTRPALKMDEVKFLDDPVGFIRIDNSLGYDYIEIYQ